MDISIVIPVYNVQAYLGECIDSVLNQSKEAYEIILVDDGSTDQSGDICDDYSRKYKQIRTIHKKNEGLGFARNTGLENVTSDYVIFIDSDDYIDSDFLEEMQHIVDKGTYDTVKTGYRRVTLEGKCISNLGTTAEYFEDSDVKEKLLPRMIGSAPGTNDSIPMSACGTLYSIKIINQYSIRFVSERKWISEDMSFNIEYFSHAQKCAIDKYIGYNYRANNNSLTTKYVEDRFEKCCAMYQKEEEVLASIIPLELWQNRLDRQFMNYLRMCFSQLKKSVSRLDPSQAKKNIKEITDVSLVEKIIRAYPDKQLNIKQRGFVLMVRWKWNWLLYVMFCIFKIE